MAKRRLAVTEMYRQKQKTAGGRNGADGANATKILVRRKHEPQAKLLEALGDLGWGELQVDPQRLQHVHAAGTGRNAPVAMLSHFRPRRSGHEHGGGCNVEGMRAVRPSGNRRKPMPCRRKPSMELDQARITGIGVR